MPCANIVNTRNKNYNEILLYINSNTDRDWNDWLEFDTIFNKPGKQGFVGLFRLKEDAQNRRVIFKISQYMDNLIKHESVIMNGLNDVGDYCQNFCRFYKTIKMQVNPKVTKKDNPFLITHKYPVETDVLLCEYLENSYKFYNYIRASSDRINENMLYSICKQVLLSISISQKKKKFTHYDLHSFNVMCKKCDDDEVFLYITGKKSRYCVPSYGFYPIIIDFGFSYIEDMEDNILWTSLSNTNIGFISDRYDNITDSKLFLVTVSNEIKNKRNTKKSAKFVNLIKNIFKPLDIDWDCGWDNVSDCGASDHIVDMISNRCKESIIFSEYRNYCIDMFHSLIILPLEKHSYTDLKDNFTVFLKEWVKIENEISSPYYNLYILFGIIESVREVRADYINNSSKNDAIKKFTILVNEKIFKVTKFCNPKNIHYEKMLCSLIILSKNMEGFLHEIINERVTEKYEEYDKMDLKNVDDIFKSVDKNIVSSYTYNKNTKITVFDSVKKLSCYFTITDDDIKILNTEKNTSDILYNIYLKNST